MSDWRDQMDDVLDEEPLYPDPDDGIFLTQDKPVFNSLIEGVVWNIADTQGLWRGDTIFSCGIFAEVYLDSKALAILELMIPDARTLPTHWIVQKYPGIRIIPFVAQEEMQKKWFDLLFSEQTHYTTTLFQGVMV